MMKISRLAFDFGQNPFFTDLDLTLPAGKTIGLVGKNGSGKTTLLKLMVGLLRPKRGSVLLDGLDIGALSPSSLAKVRAYMSQELSIPFGYRVQDLIDMTLERKQTKAKNITKETSLLQEQLEIRPLLPRVFSSLSGGEKKKVQF